MKDCAMEYRPGKRHWYKLKRDYLDGMADTLDLVLLGARTHFTLALMVDDSDNGNDDKRVHGQRQQGWFGLVVPDGLFGSRDADLADRLQGPP